MSDELINKRIEERRIAREKKQKRNKLLLVVLGVVLTFAVIISGIALHNRNQNISVDGTNVVTQSSDKESSTTESSTTETTTESTTKKPDESTSSTNLPKYEVVKKEPAPGSQKVATASIGVTGDILIHNDVLKAALTSDGNYDFNSMLSDVAPYYKKYTKIK